MSAISGIYCFNERRPRVSYEGHPLAWDGRLDNRDELLAALRDELRGQRTDAAIVMAAYRKWGADFLPHLIGDFALALWDPLSRALLLARDPFGVRTLYYHLNRERLVWSSDLRAILDVPGVDTEINDDYIAGFLKRFPDTGETPYRDIHAVPHGSVVIVRDRHLQTHQFWKPDWQAEVIYRSDAEYEERFRHLLREAVRCRLRADGAVIAQLSGGLDSSAIVCIGDQLIARGEAEASKLETLSFVYGEARTADESRFIRCVEEQRGRSGIHLKEEDHGCLSLSDDEFFVSAPTFNHCFAARQRGQREAMWETSARVMLTGQGGDQLLYSSDNPDVLLADLAAQCKPYQLHRSLLGWSRASKRPYFDLLRLAMTARRASGPQMNPPAWYDERFIERMHLRERMSNPVVCDRGLPSKRDALAALDSLIRGLSAAHAQEWVGVEVAHPYLHRPLVEFLLAIPIEQKLRPGETRSLMRRALRDVLPEQVLKRRGKQGPAEAFCRALAREWPRLQPLFADARVCERGYVSARELRAALERARHGTETQIFKLLMTISLELWLRSLECRSSAATKADTLRCDDLTIVGANELSVTV